MSKKVLKATSAIAELKFRSLIEHAHDGIVLYDAEGRIQYASPAIHRFGGYVQKDLIGKHGTDFIHADEVEMVLSYFRNIKHGESITFRQRLLHKKGYYRWGETTLTNQLHIPEVKGIISNFRDISERKEAEEKSDQFQELMETINENLEEGIFLGEFGEKFLYANTSFLKIAGYKSFSELARTRPRDFYVDDRQRVEILGLMAKHRVVRNIELQFYRKNKQKIWARMTISLLNSPARQTQYIGTIQDITKEKQAELKFQQSQKLLSSISDNVREGFFRSTPNKGLIYANDFFVKMFGYSNASEVLNVNPLNFYQNPSDRKRLLAIQKKNGVVSNAEVLYKRKDGSTFWGLQNSKIFTSDDGQQVIDGVVRDISDIKANEDAFHQVHANLLAVMESTQESIYALDKNFRYLSFNTNHQQVMKLLYNKNVVLGESIKSYLKGSKDEIWYPKEIQRAFKGEAFVKEYAVSYKNYTDRFIRISFNPIRNATKSVSGAAMFVIDVTEQKRLQEAVNQSLANLKAVMEGTKDRIFAIDKKLRYLTFNDAHAQQAKLASGKTPKVNDVILDFFPKNKYPKLHEHVFRALKQHYFTSEVSMPDGSISEVSYSPVKDQSGKVLGTAAIVRDITARKQAEAKITILNNELVSQNWKLEAREQELKLTLDELSERNFELDQFMYKTSHDLRSPLSSILGLVNLAKQDGEQERMVEYLQKIEGRVRKLDDFVKSMLSYAKVSRSEVQTSTIDLKAMINACIHELEYLDNFKKMHITIQQKESVPFQSDSMTLRLIVANIISNAFKYYNPVVNSFLKINISVSAKRALITVADNGIGIKKEYLSKISQMFFRATEKSEGSGLGMYIVKQAVDKLDGQMKIESTYGKGTTIRLEVPNISK